MVKILCTDPRPEPSIDFLRSMLPPGATLDVVTSNDDAELIRRARDAEILIVAGRLVDAHFLSMAPRVRLIQRTGAGLDNVDIAAVVAAGVMAAYTPGANAAPVAEHTIMLMLALLKRLMAAADDANAGKWRPLLFAEQGIGDLAGCRVGLVGFGNVARAVAERLHAFGSHVNYTSRRRVDPDLEDRLHATYLPLSDLLSSSQIVSLHLPLSPETYHMMSDEQLASMPRGSILLNTSRGALIDGEALRRKILSGHLAGAGLDTIEGEKEVPNPFADLPQILVTPHTAALSYQGIERVLTRAMDNARRLIAGEPVIDLIPGTPGA